MPYLDLPLYTLDTEPGRAGLIETLTERLERRGLPSCWARLMAAIFVVVVITSTASLTLAFSRPHTAPLPSFHTPAGYLAAMAEVEGSGASQAAPFTEVPGYDQAIDAVTISDLTSRATTTTTSPSRWVARPTATHTKPARNGATREAARGAVDWESIATCETGGNWGMQGQSFSGGLGFYNGAWTDFGGREFAPNAGQATREQQITVAERIRARHGLSGWGCRAHG